MNQKEQMESEEELNLTLSLRFGTSNETTTPLQTNLCLMKIQPTSSNPNPSSSSTSCSNNTNPSLASSNHNPNPPNAPAEAPESVPTVTRSSGSSRRTSRLKRTSKTVTAPFPWAKNQRATIHRHQYLMENNVHTITGKLYCRRCEHEFELGLNLEDKLDALIQFITRENEKWHTRAPLVWLSPVCPKCPLCDRENSTRPVIAPNKKDINWLFLLLGQMLGYCTLEHLKYFCKHNEIHRTGAKDRLLYNTYKGLILQLLPDYLHLFDS
ncbi:uncharacterized protein LOC114163744 [Vigna unguiculata]|uniref:DUF7086 domain-containing protein n=1 Tax=Vigna unguiculata TaxID=3917 RepID=A0A4D6NWM7_VIGUN|nr:uncharacterized protein LOC114163744 [Vigna unguiculata]QCE16805.1 hypothetical protein DEO72_LG11g3824 [Vigna unguiculata]